MKRLTDSDRAFNGKGHSSIYHVAAARKQRQVRKAQIYS